MAFRRAALLDDLWEGDMAGVVVDGRKLLLVRLDGAVHAYDNRCLHLGVALSEGQLADGVLTCRAHHYQYDARTGCGINPRAMQLRSYPIEIRDDTVFVDLEAP